MIDQQYIQTTDDRCTFPRWCFGKNIFYGTVLIILIDVVCYGFYKFDSIFSLLLGYLLLLLINKISTKAPRLLLTFCFFTTALLGLVVVVGLQRVYPAFFGMTDSSATGTDDVYFYIQAVMKTDNSILSRLPNVRPDAYYRSMHSYSQILELWNIILHKFVDVYPIDLLVINYIGICIGCIEGAKLAYHLIDDTKATSKMIILMLFCPFMLSNGLVLVRDAWVAALFIIVTERLINKRYINALPAMALLLYLRIGAILELFFLIWFVINSSRNERSKRAYSVLFLLFVLVAGIVVLRQYSTKFDFYLNQLDGITRTGIISSDGSNTRSIMYGMTPVLRIPLMTVLYFIMPTFNIGTFLRDGIFNIRNFIYTLFGLTNLILLPNYINGMFYSFRNKEKTIKYIGICFIVMMVIVSQIAQVARHKTGFVFLYYLVAIYGTTHNTPISKLIGKVAAVGLGGFYLLSLI